MNNQTNAQIVEEQLNLARQRITKSLIPAELLTQEEAKNIIGTYRVAIEPNFISWMLRAYETARSETAKNAILRNVEDEINQDHPKMLRDFAESCGVKTTLQHYGRASNPVLNMWTLFSQRYRLSDVAVAATLENTSPVFIPYLTDLGRKLGCKEFTYTDMHGEADKEHAGELYKGLIGEMAEANTPWRTLSSVVNRTCSFLESILTPGDFLI